MAHIYEKLLSALKTHWKAHSNAYPQKFVISSSDFAALKDARSSTRKAVTGNDVDDHTKFMGVKLEISDSAPGAVVDKDGTEMPLADFDKMPTA